MSKEVLMTFGKHEGLPLATEVMKAYYNEFGSIGGGE
jgi:hypothetical protein